MTADDQTLHAELMRALESGRLRLKFRIAALAGPGSPVFDAREAAVLLVAVAALIAAPALIGGTGYTGTVGAGIGLVAFFWARWYWQRVKRRAVEAVQADAAAWEDFWRRGAFELAGGDARGRDTCMSPTGDWRAFVRRRAMDEDRE